MDCSIEEFYNGSLKTLTYHKDILRGDGRSIENVEETMIIEVKPGYSTETVLVFKDRGNEKYACQRSALKVMFSLQNGEKNPYTRSGNDLVYTHDVTLVNAMLNKPVKLETLDRRFIAFTFEEMITPQSEYLIKGEGMPILGQPGKKGDLKVHFNVVFPQQIASDKRDAILKLIE